jgi:predicted transcriptional regulator
MAEKLLQMMKKRGITSQTELSRISGVPQPMISMIITGDTKDPRLSTMVKLARALRCAVEDLDDDSYEETEKRA